MFQGFYWTSIIMLHTVERCIEWLHEVPDDKGGVVFFKWCRGKNAHGLCFGARSNFVDELDILGDGVLVVAGETAPMQWSAARVTPHKPLAGLTRFSVGSVLIGRGKHHWDPQQWQEVAKNMIDNNVRIVMMIADSPIRNCGERLAQTMRQQGVNAERMGEAYHSNIQFLMLGKSSGFLDDLGGYEGLSTAVAVDKPYTRCQWKNAVLGTEMEVQDTLGMLLPPIKLKQTVCPRNLFWSVWLRGAGSRSPVARIQRGENREMRRQRQASKWSHSDWWPLPAEWPAAADSQTDLRLKLSPAAEVSSGGRPGGRLRLTPAADVTPPRRKRSRSVSPPQSCPRKCRKRDKSSSSSAVAENSGDDYSSQSIDEDDL